MADKMMRVSGRGEDGLAKPISTTDDGFLKTQLMGSNAELGTNTKELSHIAESLPFAQDITNFEVSGNLFYKGAAGAWDDLNDLHSCKLYYSRDWTKKWRIYYVGRQSGGDFKVGLVEADSPEGPWTRYGSNPVLVADQPYENLSHGVGALVFTRAPGSAGVAYKGYYQYRKSDGNFWTAKVESGDGYAWGSKKELIFDKSVTDLLKGVGFTSVYYDISQKLFIASAHVSTLDHLSERLVGAILVSPDGINWSLKSVIHSPTTSHAASSAPELFDAHWLAKAGSTYILFATTMAYRTTATQDTMFAVSTNLEDWYIYPELIAKSDSKWIGRYRYVSFQQIEGTWYGIGIPIDKSNNLQQVRLIKIETSSPYSAVMINKTSLSGGSATVDSDAKTLNLKKQDVSVTASCSFANVSSGGDATVNIYSSTNGVDWDTDPLSTFNLTFKQNSKSQKTLSMKTSRYLKAEVVNKDATNAITNIKVTAVFSI